MPETPAEASVAVTGPAVEAAAPPRVSEARERLLRVASELFYREGVHSVGMERVLREAGVTRATMYRHFSGKEALVAACLTRQDAAARAVFAPLTRALDAAAPLEQEGRASVIELLVAGVADDIEREHTRGCPFINAAVEYPDASSEVRRIVAAHRAWFRELVHRTLIAAGTPDPHGATAQLVLLRDGALIGAYLDGPEAARTAFTAAALRIAAP